MPLGQTIFDALSTAAGHPINRGAINAQVAEAQSLNAYRDAETQDAFNKARMSRDQAETYENEQNSIDHLASSLTPTFGDPDIARAAAFSLYKTGNLQEFYKGLSEHDVQTLQDRYDNANVNDRPIILQSILAHQDPQALAQIQAGAPLKAAQTANENSQTALHQGQLAALQQKNSAGGGIDPGAVNWEAYRIYKGLPMDALGMGNGGIRVAAISQAAKMASQAQQNGQDWSEPAFDHMIANNLQYAGTHAGVVAGARGYAAGTANQNQLRLETAVQHLQQIPELVQSLKTGDARPLNSLAATFGIQMNQPAQVIAQLVAHALGSEVAAVYAPAGSTQQDRDGYATQFMTQLLSPQAAMSVKARAEGLIEGRLDSLRQSYIDSHGYQSPQAAAQDFNKGLTAVTQQVYGLGTGQQLTGPGQSNYGGPAAQSGPSAGGAPPPSDVSAGSAGSPPRLTQTPPGTPGGTPSGAAPGPQAPGQLPPGVQAPGAPVQGAQAPGAPIQGVAPAPSLAPPASSGGPPNAAQQPAGHQNFPTTGPHGFAPPPQLLRQASDPNDPGINHLSNGEVWSWRAGDVPRYVGMMPVPTPGQGTTQTPNMPVGNNGLNNPTQ